MASTRITLNHREIQSYLDGDHGVEAMLEEAAERALSRSGQRPGRLGCLPRQPAHRDRPHRPHGQAGHGDVDYALVVEANTGNLARALDSAR
jgi:hypothetical protein